MSYSDPAPEAERAAGDDESVEQGGTPEEETARATAGAEESGAEEAGAEEAPAEGPADAGATAEDTDIEDGSGGTPPTDANTAEVPD